MRYNILGVGFDNITSGQAAKSATDLVLSGGRGYVVTPNPEIVWLCRKDKQALDAVNGAYLVLPDGIGVVYAAKLLGYPIKTRSPGIEFATLFIEAMSKNGKKLFLLGAKPGVAEAAADNLQKNYPGLNICGTNDGYFSEDAPVIEKINLSGADAVFVCLGAPKQELWMAKNKDLIKANIMAGLGGSLDVFAGVVSRAPEIWQKLNLEWLYRAVSTRGRFLRILKLPAFLIASAAEGLRGMIKHG